MEQDILVTKDEMEGFISGLFDEVCPKPSPDLELTMPDAGNISSEGISFVTEDEVKGFISDLF